MSNSIYLGFKSRGSIYNVTVIITVVVAREKRLAAGAAAAEFPYNLSSRSRSLKTNGCYHKSETSVVKRISSILVSEIFFFQAGCNTKRLNKSYIHECNV